MKFLGICYILLFLYSTTNGQSTKEKDYYTGAVVEYATLRNPLLSPGENIRTNVDEYVKYIGQAKEKEADIVVFPEDGLTSIYLPADVPGLRPYTSLVPDPTKREIPCGKDAWTDVLQRLSCAAKKNQIYVVVNLPERHMIDSAEKDSEKFMIFNTNVVFDRTGAVIAKYRKYNLYNEAAFNVTDTPDMTTFVTDFGVTFGTLICFDILFAKPAKQLLKLNDKVTDIVYTTAWFSELPFLTGVQTQYGWARAHGVNLLAAGYSDPAIGSGGSGIYAANGNVTFTMPVSKQTTLITLQIKKITRRVLPDTVDANFAKVERINKDARYLGKMRMLKENMTNYTTVLVNETNVDKQKICHGQLCCTFTVNFVHHQTADYRYRMVVYDGPRVFGIEENYVQICGLAACKNSSAISCGEQREEGENPQVFDNISINGKFRDDDNTVVFPSNVRYDLSILVPSDIEYRVTPSSGYKTVLMKTTKSVDHLLAFGIYAVTKSAAGMVFALGPAALLGVTALLLFFKLGN